MTREEAVKILKSKMDGSVDTSYEWAEAVRMAIEALKAPTESTNTPTNAPTDLISRQDAIKAVENLGHERWSEYDYAFNDGISKAVTTINALPSAEPKTGEWVVVSDGYGNGVATANICECSVCGDTVWVYKDGERRWNYCPRCGAKMGGDSDV